MISALYRFPKSRRRSVARLWGCRSAASRAGNRLALGVDAATLARRANATPFSKERQRHQKPS